MENNLCENNNKELKLKKDDHNCDKKIHDLTVPTKIIGTVPKKRQDLLKWNGWGYKDSTFILEKRILCFTGGRYPIGDQKLPEFTKWVMDTFNVDLDSRRESQDWPKTYPVPLTCPKFCEGLKELKIDFSDLGEDRLIRAHGQTLRDIYLLREGTFKRIPDLVVWPVNHDEVVKIIKLADENNVVIIPFGGGTSVSGSATCPENEERVIVALDTLQMNRMLWIDKDNLVACFECGILGQDLERTLQKIGLTVGHEPDSYEFSTLGGWVATRASGMKKNVYGNIEDLVVRVRMATCKGVLEKNVSAPRISCGPDFNHIILGSEGTLGVITEVLLKVRPLPPVKRYGSLVFPDFDSGIHCLREVAKRRCQPASVRLIDNEQFKFGQGLKAKVGVLGTMVDGLKKFLVTKVKGFDINKMCVATLVFEGEPNDVKNQEKTIVEIAKKYGGLAAGAQNGERGYTLTFVIAYIRDIGLEFGIVAESFETSCPWDRCSALCQNVKNRIKRECEVINIKHYLISCRVTQTYDAGCCIYFYFGFNNLGLKDPVDAYEHIENEAREEIIASGGSISHHHGIGKLRSRWYPQSISTVGVGLFKAAKYELDPNNVFGNGNLLEENNQGHKAKL